MRKFQRGGGHPITKVSEVKVRRLKDIFDEYGIKHIDFLNIDVEGLEIKVLKSIDFSSVQIDYILLEQFEENGITKLMESEEYALLRAQGFIVVAIYGITVIYKHIKRE